jgi:hypothetical protein
MREEGRALLDKAAENLAAAADVVSGRAFRSLKMRLTSTTNLGRSSASRPEVPRSSRSVSPIGYPRAFSRPNASRMWRVASHCSIHTVSAVTSAAGRGGTLMAILQPRHTKEEFARRGDAIFERDIRPLIERRTGGSSWPSTSKPERMKSMPTRLPHRTACWPDDRMPRSGWPASVPARCGASAHLRGADAIIAGVVTLTTSPHLAARGWTYQARQEIRALIDTGFDGCLTLHSGLIVTLGPSLAGVGERSLRRAAKACLTSTKRPST